MHPDLSAGRSWLDGRSLPDRKRMGQWVTPWWVVEAVVARACRGLPSRPVILDPACGDGRWLLAAARVCPDARLIGIDLDPSAIAAAEQTLAAAGVRAELLCDDALIRPLPAADLVLGNPPYVRPQNLPREVRDRLWARFSVATDKIDLYACFVEHSLDGAARVALVIPRNWLSLTSFAALRHRVLEAGVDGIFVLPKRTFDATVDSLVLLCGPDDVRATGSLDAEGFAVSHTLHVGPNAWSVDGPLPELPGRPLGELVHIHMGVVCGDYGRYVHDERRFPEDRPTCRGRDVHRWEIHRTGEHIRYLPREMLQRKPYVAPKHAGIFDVAHKIVVAGTTGRTLRAAMDTERLFPLDSCYVILPRTDAVDLWAVLGLLHSPPVQDWYGRRFRAARVKGVEMARIPVPSEPLDGLAAAARARDDAALTHAAAQLWTGRG